MEILPALSEIGRIAADGKYRVLPVSCEILSDFITPIEALRILKNSSAHRYMLESAQADEKWGRYTFLGFEPKTEITCVNGVLQAGGGEIRTENPSGYIRQKIKKNKAPSIGYMRASTGRGEG